MYSNENVDRYQAAATEHDVTTLQVKVVRHLMFWGL